MSDVEPWGPGGAAQVPWHQRGSSARAFRWQPGTALPRRITHSPGTECSWSERARRLPEPPPRFSGPAAGFAAPPRGVFRPPPLIRHPAPTTSALKNSVLSPKNHHTQPLPFPIFRNHKMGGQSREGTLPPSLPSPLSFTRSRLTGSKQAARPSPSRCAASKHSRNLEPQRRSHD